MGRQQTYSDQDIANILSLMTEGKTLIECAKQSDIAYSTLFKRIVESEFLSELYARVREDYCDYKVAEMNEIAKDTSIETHRARLMCDNIKWEVAKVKPKFYGDRKTHEHEGNVSVTISKDDAEL